jgi:hypothetical protein
MPPDTTLLGPLFEDLEKFVSDAQYSAGVASGELYFDPAGMATVIHDLDGQLASVRGARAQSNAQLSGVNPSAEITEVSGVNSAWRWLSSTAVAGTALVSFQDNLTELDHLVQYLRDQMSRVLNAYATADSAASDSLNGAAATVFSDNRRPDESSPVTDSVGWPV